MLSVSLHQFVLTLTLEYQIDGTKNLQRDDESALVVSMHSYLRVKESQMPGAIGAPKGRPACVTEAITMIEKISGRI